MKFLNRLVDFTKYFHFFLGKKVKKASKPISEKTVRDEQPDSLPSAISEVQNTQDIHKPGKEHFVIEHEKDGTDGLEYWKYDPLEKL